jgi:hypothetical protein
MIKEIAYADDHNECLGNANALGISTYFYDNFENYKEYLIEIGVNIAE